jgi:hypothetical protein
VSALPQSNQVISRADAKVQGLKRYYIALPCSKGHDCERYVCDKQCVECCRIKLREKYAKNPEKQRKRHSVAYWSNVDTNRAINAERARIARKEKPDLFAAQEKREQEKIKNDPILLEKERERQRKKQAKAYAENPEKLRLRRREYHRSLTIEKRSTLLQKYKEYKKQNPDVIRALNQKHNPIDRLARMKRVPPWLTEEDKAKIRAIYNEARERNMHVDHIIPLQGKIVSGLHVPQNLQLLTPSENASKKNKYEVQ